MLLIVRLGVVLLGGVLCSAVLLLLRGWVTLILHAWWVLEREWRDGRVLDVFRWLMPNACMVFLVNGSIALFRKVEM
jgi:hypothetical protein